MAELAEGAGPGTPSGVSRRGFVRGTAAVGATAALPGWLSARPRPARGSTPRIVIIGSGIAGLGCAYRLWRRYGLRAEIYEYDDRFGGRIETVRGFFDDGQVIEQHGEFINPEHTAMLALAASFGLSLDNTDHYPPGTHPGRLTLRFGGKTYSQAALNEAWRNWGWSIFRRAAARAGWPILYNRHTKDAWRWDHMSVPEWIDTHLPGGLDTDFADVCLSAVLDEYGGPPDQQSALNLITLLGWDDSRKNGLQSRRTPQLAGGDEKWHIRGGNDQVITGILGQLPAGVAHLNQHLLAVRRRGGRYVCTLQSGASTRDVVADHVVLTPAPTKLAEVDLSGVDISPLHRRAIAEQPLGSNCKVDLQFTHRIWNTADHSAANFYTDRLPQSGWDATNYQPGAAGILISFPGGAAGARLGARYGLTNDEGPAPAAMVRDYLAAVEVLYPGVSSAYNGKAYYEWSDGDFHIGGAYSYLKVGQYTSFNGIQGQREGNLHFAGEATSVNFEGYMEGGLRTGYRAADEVAAG